MGVRAMSANNVSAKSCPGRPRWMPDQVRHDKSRGDVVGFLRCAPTMSAAKSCPGRPRRIVARRLGLLDFVAARLRAS